MTQKKFTQLTQATNAEQGDDDVAAIVIDPGGSPASRKTTLARMGAPGRSWVSTVFVHEPTPGAVSAGSFSTGIRFCARRAGQTCTGVRFYWAGATARTVKCTLWKGGASVKTVDVAVSGAGYYTGTFASAAAITAYEEWYVSVWDKSATEYQLHQSTAKLPTMPLWLRDYTVLLSSLYVAGDAQPTTTFSATDGYPVEPVVTG